MKARSIVVAVALLAAAGCSSDKAASPSTTSTAAVSTTSTAITTTTTTAAPTTTSTATATTTPGSAIPAGPAGDAFYVPPSPIPGTAAGDVIWARPLTSVPAGTVGWDVLYRSESVGGDPIAVSGVVIASASAKPASPVLTWAHGTTGLADKCAPSKSDDFATDAIGRLAVSQGWVYTGTDYEGLGTPGVHPYLVGLSSGRGVLDIVRAAHQLLPTAVTTDSPVMIFGHSQGGGAALFAAEQAATYAPELNVIGTVAGAPAGDLDTIAAAAPSIGSGGGFLLMAIAGFEAAYPGLPLDAVINTPEAVTAVADTCTTDAFALAAQPGLQFLDPLTDPQWKTVIDENTAGQVEPSAPVLIVHGEADTTVPRALSDVTLKRYCSVGATIELKSYPGADHVGVLTAAAVDIVSFFTARLAGTPATSSCPAG